MQMLCHFIEGTSASIDFDIRGRTISPGSKAQLYLKGGSHNFKLYLKAAVEMWKQNLVTRVS